MNTFSTSTLYAKQWKEAQLGIARSRKHWKGQAVFDEQEATLRAMSEPEIGLRLTIAALSDAGTPGDLTRQLQIDPIAGGYGQWTSVVITVVGSPPRGSLVVQVEPNYVTQRPLLLAAHYFDLRNVSRLKKATQLKAVARYVESLDLGRPTLTTSNKPS